MAFRHFHGCAVNNLGLFDNSLEVIKEGTKYLRLCCSVNSIIYALMYTFDSFLIGIGKARLAMINAMLDAFVIRIPLAFFFKLLFPIRGNRNLSRASNSANCTNDCWNYLFY